MLRISLQPSEELGTFYSFGVPTVFLRLRLVIGRVVGAIRNIPVKGSEWFAELYLGALLLS